MAYRVLWLEDGKLRERKEEASAPGRWVRDPVCGMRVDEWTATIFLGYAGQRRFFCSARCLERFQAAPERYLEART